jgi:hypothetical protein
MNDNYNISGIEPGTTDIHAAKAFGGHKHPFDMRGQSITCNSTELGENDAGGGFTTPYFREEK